MKYYAIIDTNVIVSALLKDNSIPNKILKLVFSGFIVPVFNKSILQEYKEVLSRPKFHFPQQLVSEFLASFEKYGRILESKPQKFNKAKPPDPGDWKFYELLLQCQKSNESYLVTGNIKHFPSDPSIVTPRQMFEMVTRGQ